jgi:hypothetical protein
MVETVHQRIRSHVSRAVASDTPVNRSLRTGCATLLLSFGLLAGLSGCVSNQSGIPAAARSFGNVGYVRDPTFPQSSGISFGTVSWVERDARGQIVVVQRAQPPVSVWTPQGALVSSWTTETLGDPHSISFHSSAGTSTAWVTDMAPPLLAGTGYGHCLKQFTAAGNPVSAIGTCGEDSQGTGLNPVQFDEVTDVAWNAAGNLVVSDGDVNGLNNRVLTLDPRGNVLANWSAPGDKPGSGPGQFHLPHSLVVDRCDRVWIADALNHRVQVIASDGTFRGALTAFGDLGVYAVAFGAELTSPAEAVVFVGASPSTGGGTGKVSLFLVSMNCNQPSVANVAPFATFNVPLPPSTSTTLLHSIAVDPATWDVYVAVLGTGLPPQKWTPSPLPRKTP